jgi:hypothetical protein
LLENVWNKIQDTKDTIEVDYHEIERLFYLKNNTTLRVNTRREVNTLFMTICLHFITGSYDPNAQSWTVDTHYITSTFTCSILPLMMWYCLVWLMVFNATFNNISVIWWQSVLLVEETRVPGDKRYHMLNWTHNVSSDKHRLHR